MSNNYKEIWSNCLSIIKDNISTMSFKTWFEPVVPIRVNGNVLTIQVPSHFFYEYLEEHYIDILRRTLRKELGLGAKLEYTVIMDKNGMANKQQTLKVPTKYSSQLKNKPVPLPLNVNESTIKNPFVIPGIKKIQVDPQLNPNLTFGTFVEGECNRLARSAGYAVASKPGGTAFNPLLLYGDSGLGKTHLANAIGIEGKNKFSDKIVLYVSANKFQTQFVEATRNNNINDFIHFYQMIDILIIDDVQEFAGKQKTQNTFFHIFNHLHQSGKQLILTCDKPPVELKGLEQRLLSRFKWGLAADLQVPNIETRVAILKQKIYNDGIVMSNDVIEYIAKSVNTSVRELEGALISLLAQSTLNRKDITLELTKQMIDKLVKSTKREITIKHIQKIVCDYFDLDVDVLQSKTRKKEIVQARQIAMYFAKKLTKSSLSAIGSQIGRKDHATVLHAYRTVTNLAETDKQFKSYLDEIYKNLK